MTLSILFNSRVRQSNSRRKSLLLSVAIGLIGSVMVAQTGAIAHSLPDLSTPAAPNSFSPNSVADPIPNPAVSPAAFSTVSPRDAASAYLLGAGDQLQITVYGFEEYTGPLLVLPDGTIDLALIGKIPAAGRTTDQLQRDLTAALDRILVDPQVSITLNSLRPVVVSVSGEVYRPGPTQLQGATSVTAGSESTGSPASVSAALIQAGGVTRTANVREIVVLRASPDGRTLRTTINLWDALLSETLPTDMLLRDGDLVFVPQLAAGELLDARLLARSSLSPDTVRVRVVGEVTRPGEVPVPPNSSLSSAVAIAGGPTDDAKLSDVAFIRRNDAGEVTQKVVDLRNLIDNYQVQDGDVIVVPKTNTGSVLDFAQRLLGPLGFFLGIF